MTLDEFLGLCSADDFIIEPISPKPEPMVPAFCFKQYQGWYKSLGLGFCNYPDWAYIRPSAVVAVEIWIARPMSGYRATLYGGRDFLVHAKFGPMLGGARWPL